MGKKINCTSTLRGRKSKDQGGKEIKGRATIYTPEILTRKTVNEALNICNKYTH